MILAPPDYGGAAVRDMASVIGRLRERAGRPPSEPPVLDASKPKTAGTAEIILNCDSSSKKNGFAWRAAPERIEIYGHSPRSLDNAIFDFLSALGVIFPSKGSVRLPEAHDGTRFSLNVKGNHLHHTEKRTILCVESSRRFAFLRGAILHAGRSGFDEVIFPLDLKLKRSYREELRALARSYHLEVARGGCDLSPLVPRRYFWLRRELFRMEDGRRRRDGNFCPVSDATQRIISATAARYFEEFRGTARYYFLAAGGLDKNHWCSCPVCRALPFEEQYLMAVYCAARALESVDPTARVGYERPPEGACQIRPHENMDALNGAATVIRV